MRNVGPDLPFSLADGPIFGSHVWNAMWENMRIQVDDGILPPYAPRIEIVEGADSQAPN